MVRPSFQEISSNQPELVSATDDAKLRLVPSNGRNKKGPEEFKNANEFFVANVQDKVKEIESLQLAGKTLAKPTSNEYPCIDISPWLNLSTSSSEDRQEVVRRVLEEAMKAGSFNIVGHGVPTRLLDDVEQEAKNFFNKPLEEKQNYRAPSDHHKGGYVELQGESGAAVLGESEREGENRDWREVYAAVYPPSSKLNVTAPGALQTKIKDYMESMNALDAVLHDILTAALVMAKGVSLETRWLNDRAKDGATGSFRLSKYPKSENQRHQDASKLIWHSDWGTITVLYSSSPGLEELREGEIVQVPMGQGQLHVVVGEILTVASNGLFPVNIHRVGPTAADDRISLAYFAGQGEKETVTETGQGILPVCAPGEVPLFTTPVSTTTHVKNYFDVYYNS